MDVGSAKANGREPESGLGRVFNFKLGCYVYNCMAFTSTAESRVQNRFRNVSLDLSSVDVGSGGYYISFTRVGFLQHATIFARKKLYMIGPSLPT